MISSPVIGLPAWKKATPESEWGRLATTGTNRRTRLEPLSNRFEATANAHPAHDLPPGKGLARQARYPYPFSATPATFLVQPIQASGFQGGDWTEKALVSRPNPVAVPPRRGYHTPIPPGGTDPGVFCAIPPVEPLFQPNCHQRTCGGGPKLVLSIGLEMRRKRPW